MSAPIRDINFACYGCKTLMRTLPQKGEHYFGAMLVETRQLFFRPKVNTKVRR